MVSSVTSAGAASGIDFESIISASVAAKKASLSSRISSRKENTQLEITGVGLLKSNLTTFKDLLDNMTKEIHAVKPTDDPKKNENFMLSFSAGVACFPEDAESFEDLKQCADVALYDVKKRGRNGYCWYHPKLEFLRN